MTNKSRNVVAQGWVKITKGVKQSPGGVSIHLTEKDCVAYVTKNCKKMLGSKISSVYSTTAGDPHMLKVSHEIFGKIKNSENGVWFSSMPSESIRVRT